MIQWGKQYYWDPSLLPIRHIGMCKICLQYNSGKLLHASLSHFPLPRGSFKVRQLELIQLPFSQGYKYVLVMIWMFSHQVEAFPCHQAMALAVAKPLLEKFIPSWGSPSRASQ